MSAQPAAAPSRLSARDSGPRLCPANPRRRAAAVMAAIALAMAVEAGSCATDASRRQAAAWTEIGNAWAELDKWDKAGDAWSRAIAIDAGQAVAGYNLSRALAEAGKYDEAIAQSDAYLASDPDNAAVLAIKAYSLHKAGRVDEAVSVYERVATLNGGDAASEFNLAILYEAAGRTSDAMERYDALLLLKPDDPRPSYRKGLLLAADGKPAEALPYVERYALADGAPVEAKRALALVREDAGLYADAMKSWQALAEAGEGDSGAWFELARIRLTAADDEAGGLEALAKAISLGWKDAKAGEKLLATPSVVAGDKVREMIEKALAAQPAPNPDAAAEEKPIDAEEASDTGGSTKATSK